MRSVRKDRAEGIRAARRPPRRVDPDAPARLRAEQRPGHAWAAGGGVVLAVALVWTFGEPPTLESGFGKVPSLLLYVLGAFAAGATSGLAVREAGRGIEPVFPRIAAGSAALGCLIGEIGAAQLSLYSPMLAGLAAAAAYPLARRRLTEREATALWRERMGLLDEGEGPAARAAAPSQAAAGSERASEGS